MNWIDVKNRLPSEDDTILIHMVGGEMRTAIFAREYPSFEETFTAFNYWSDSHGCNKEIEWDTVTHWMPLPQPPEVNP